MGRERNQFPAFQCKDIIRRNQNLVFGSRNAIKIINTLSQQIFGSLKFLRGDRIQRKQDTTFQLVLTCTAADPRANQPSGWRGFNFRANFLQQYIQNYSESNA